MLEPEERERFERVVMPHQDAAFNLARWLLRSRVDAEDVAFDSARAEDEFLRDLLIRQAGREQVQDFRLTLG